jgi:FKBP-type peptidyl-prolyl cis-trans isomerase SlyD
MKIASLSFVTIDYVLSDERGEVLQDSKIDGSMAYVHGFDLLIPALERALTGHGVSDRVRITLPPEEAYGFRDPELVELVPLSSFEGSGPIEIGMRVEAFTAQGRAEARVVGLEGDQVRLDRNHPLAERSLTFEIEVLDVRTASAEEIAHARERSPRKR